MLGFIQFLMEARDHVAAAKEEFGDNLNHIHDTYLPPELHGKGHEIIDHIRKLDPSPSGKYTPWLTREYHAGRFRLGSDGQEDKAKVHAVLGSYQNAQGKTSYPEEPGTHHTTSSLLRPKVKGISTNILHHSMHDLSHKLSDDISKRLAKMGPSKREMKKQNTEHGATKVWENEHVEFWHLHKHEAAARFDPGRSWCTTRDKDTFKEHSNLSPLMVAVPKAEGEIPKHHGNVQWHTATGQTMNKNDEPIDFDYKGGNRPDDTADKMHPLMKQAFVEAHFAHPEIAKLNYQNENSLMKKAALAQVRDVRDGKLTVDSEHGKMYEPLQKHVYDEHPDKVPDMIRHMGGLLHPNVQVRIAYERPELLSHMIEHVGENLHELTQSTIMRNEKHRHLIPHMIRSLKGSLRRNTQYTIVAKHPEHIGEIITHTGQNFHSDLQIYTTQNHPEHIPHMLQSLGPKTNIHVQNNIVHEHPHLIPHMIKHVGKELPIGIAEYIRQKHPEHAPLLKKAGIK